MSKPSVESGAQLLSRVTSELRPSLTGLCDDIFPDNGPLPGRVIEITGDGSTGKCHFLMELMARTILPHAYGGREASVVLFDLANKFRMQRFLYILEKIACPTTATSEDIAIKEAIENSLNRLLVCSCYTPDEYELAQMQAENMLASDTSIALIAIDSVSVFYWLDCKQKMPLKMDTYLKKAVQGFQKLSQEHKIVVAYIRPAHFAANAGCLPTTDANTPDYRIRLLCHKSEGVRGFEAEMDARGESRNTFFTIDNFGVKFLALGS